ncbi:MAG: hypothetical protein JWQ90_4391 [Hydrocarboniphaga sp.]|uniref:BrnT family toxin n=1 Tax=Hydrocarboniphaga sp. TaxID=2033016 RepID=UPI00263641C7|nr:BrnT family toxin [Hydrocarboniphaga sp.]MDB5971941.1 hypothetical protein [Hydrocarboniphaga sp.]
MLTWDEPKRLANIAEHGFDFVGVDAIFDGPVWSYEDDREAYGEQRINLVGWLNGRLMHLTYTDTDDGGTMRAISLRKAEKHEIRRYVQAIAR